MAATRDYLGSFRLIKMIRAGGTCQVWEAFDDRSQKRVALKVLQPEVRSDKHEIAFLRHEHEVGHALNHSHVIEVYDFRIERDQPFLVMELSRSRNLKLLLHDHGADGVAVILKPMLEQAAMGLDYFHQQGWTHCDIKPDNFLANEEGRGVKLIDFALATRIRSGFGRLLQGKAKLQGTRSYMAPEQIRRQQLKATVDVYAFGCMAYELVCGKVPFTGSTSQELLQKHISSPAPALIAVNNNVTQEFSDVVLHMLEKKPERRMQSLSDFLANLQTIRIFKRSPKAPQKNETPTSNESEAG